MPTDYYAIRRQIRNYDMLAFRAGNSDVSQEIAGLARGSHSHIGGAVWRPDRYGGTLSCAESREGHGGRVVSLSTQVRTYPGMIDVYTPNYECSDELREAAATIMYRWAGNGYDYPGILKMWFAHLPCSRRALAKLGLVIDPTDMTLATWEHFKVCSALYGWAARWAKSQWSKIKCAWDAVPGMGDLFIEPSDLVHSGSFRLKFPALTLEV